jgi:hypothetical protein
MANATELMKRAQQSMARAKAKEQATTHMAVSKGAGLATSVGLALASNKLPVSIANIPTKLLIAGAAYLGAYMTKGNVRRALESTGDASSNIYAYLAALKVKAGESKAWVAGDDDETDDESGYVVEV